MPLEFDLFSATLPYGHFISNLLDLYCHESILCQIYLNFAVLSCGRLTRNRLVLDYIACKRSISNPRVFDYIAMRAIYPIRWQGAQIRGSARTSKSPFFQTL